MEVSLQHLLPNFKECWWDHYLLDVFGCNLAGMLLGMWTCRHYANKEFNWKVCERAETTTRGIVSLRQCTFRQSRRSS